MTAGMLPECEVAFLDEIFKANSAILNALLALLNEREFKMGASTVKCPLQICVGASNELPEANEGLEALYDRFSLRRWVDYIRDDDNFEALWDMDEAPAVGTQLDLSDVQVLRDNLRHVDTSGIKHAIIQLRKDLAQQHGIVPSDRRWRTAKRLVQAHALLDGRLVANGSDVLILADSLWEKPEDRAAIYGLIASTVSPDLATALALYDAAVEAMASVDLDSDDADAITNISNANKALKGTLAEMRKLDQSGGVDGYVTKVEAMHKKVVQSVMRNLGM
jgi:MoxR-like ATPase